MLLKRGNAKLGPDIYTWSLPSVATCPGATSYCMSRCYASKTERIYSSARNAWRHNFELTTDLEALTVLLTTDLSRLKPGSVIRLHVSGDFFSVEYTRMWIDLATAHPGLTFYAYTRSWTHPRILPELERLNSLPNVTVWFSYDPDMPEVPEGHREARMVGKHATGAPGAVTCLEQSGRRESCQECGLCWNPNLKPNAKLAFIEH